MDTIYFKIDNLTTSYGKFNISNVSFQLKSRDIMGLVGRSGSGKSTLIKTLIGLKKPDSGMINVYIDNKQFPLTEMIGYSPQENALYPFLTLEENLMTFGKLQKLKKDEIEKRADFLLKRLDLQKSRKKRITELSGGMQKRADLAVTLVHNPKIIILDEPFTGLDISLQRFIWDLLKELSSEGRIIIISSHLLSDIQKNCNQFGLIENNIFYNTQQIIQTIKAGKEKSLEFFLEKLFTRDLMLNE